MEHHLVGDVARLADRRHAGEAALAEIRPDGQMFPRQEIHPAVLQQRTAEIVRFGETAAEVEPLQTRTRIVERTLRAARAARKETAAWIVRGNEIVAGIAGVEPGARIVRGIQLTARIGGIQAALRADRSVWPDRGLMPAF